MASRKQRRRRAKERRHEYEYVYVDDTGEEIEAPPEGKPAKAEARTKRSANGSKEGRAKAARPLREAKPPSWNRSLRRSLLFLPLFFIVFSFVNKHQALLPRVAYSVLYSALFVPLTYVMDRTAYRTYLRRSGQQPEAKR
jgi:hypothetical protein